MKKLLLLFPTRYRVELAQKAFKSIKDNAVNSDVVFCFQANDSCLNDYKAVFCGEKHIVCGDIGLSGKVNALVEKYFDPEIYDATFIHNDDQVVMTPEFDRLLLERLDKKEKESGHRLWILDWNDGIHHGNLCQSFATKEMLEIQEGKYFTGEMRHYFNDNIYKDVGTACGILEYVPEVFIEHRHPDVGKAVRDKGYLESMAHTNEDRVAYAKWKSETAPVLIAKMKRYIEERKNG